ncbi:MAG: conjugal transfer protein TraX [Oscillospiraceae bacterium]|nr:conjugal transfer protein TraX [Oscillospiraceae bacterium]
MNATKLKYLALLCMTVDHIGTVFTPMATVAVPGSIPYYLLNYIGRLAFPIFAFLVAESCRKTEHYPRYLIRLGVFGGASHVLTMFLSTGSWGSTILTFFFAVLGIYLGQRILAHKLPLPTALLPALLLAVAAEFLHTDYGLLGVLTVVVLYYCGESKTRQLIALAICICVTYLPLYPLPFNLLFTVCACAALIPLCFYNGERGRGRTNFFYWYYPLHILALYLLRAIL